MSAPKTSTVNFGLLNQSKIIAAPGRPYTKRHPSRMTEARNQFDLVGTFEFELAVAGLAPGPAPFFALRLAKQRWRGSCAAPVPFYNSTHSRNTRKRQAYGFNFGVHSTLGDPPTCPQWIISLHLLKGPIADPLSFDSFGFGQRPFSFW